MQDDIDALTTADFKAARDGVRRSPAYQAALNAEVGSALWHGWSREELAAEIERRKQMLAYYESLAEEGPSCG